uniref:PB1 domain-containing protein n=1 Tax=Chenopodium quinoa TaxID=63459 RepID=A0A803M492_CHEQI
MDLSPSTPPATTSPTVVVGGAKKDSKTSAQKLRLMLSFNGHILPRPHDKTLFYAGGETRIISIPRNSSLSLSSLFSHIAKSFFNGSLNFLLKYQLPNHDLDSLISISSDEDLFNMVDEYDRLLCSGSGSRIRFFLFKKEEPVRDFKCDDDCDCSIPSPNFSQQGIVYQDASGFFDSNLASVNPVETESNASDRSPRSDILTSVQVSGYMVSKPMDKPQHQSPPQPPSLATATPHYIHYATPQSNYAPQYYPNSIPVASYPPMYPTYVQPHQPVQYQLNKPYPVYMMPMGQTQNMYDASMPRTMTTAPNVARSQPHVPSNPVVVSPPIIYEGYNKPATPVSEFAAEVYMPAAMATQPVTLPAVHQPAQPVTVPPIEKANYISEFEDPMHAQIYKTQPSGLILPSQLQMAQSAATAMLPESFTQLQLESTKH